MGQPTGPENLAQADRGPFRIVNSIINIIIYNVSTAYGPWHRPWCRDHIKLGLKPAWAACGLLKGNTVYSVCMQFTQVLPFTGIGGGPFSPLLFFFLFFLICICIAAFCLIDVCFLFEIFFLIILVSFLLFSRFALFVRTDLAPDIF